MDGNYIKIDRKILEWEWYGNINTCRLFFHMLLKANWKDGKFQGRDIPRGSFVSSIGKLAEGTKLTEDEVRTAIKNLVKTGEVTKQSTNKYTVFTVVKYDLYQCTSQTNPKQIPSNSQTIPKLFPTIEERKKERREESNNTPISPIERFEEFWAAYPKKGNRFLAEQEYCTAILSGVPEEDLVKAAVNYAEHCQRQRTKNQFIKNPENFIRDNVFINYVKGEQHGRTGNDTGTNEKSLNDLMYEQGIGGEFDGF